jgi:hypothetical protein
MSMCGAIRAVDQQERLDRVVAIGERPLRRTLHECATYRHCERDHLGLAHELIDGHPVQQGLFAAHSDSAEFTYYFRSAASAVAKLNV